MQKDWPKGILQAISDALVGYLTFQARCGLSPAYSEYLLYDPIVRVCRNRSWHVECEVAIDKTIRGRGDHKRVDFRLRKRRSARRALLLEVKYHPRIMGRPVPVKPDCVKLRTLLGESGAGSRAFVLIAGRQQKSNGGFAVTPALNDAYYTTVYPAAHTNFGVTVYEVGQTNNGMQSDGAPRRS